MTDKADDLEAVRKVTQVLSEFAAADQERIIRWTREKIGLPAQPRETAEDQGGAPSTGSIQRELAGGVTDIRTFVAQKNPASDNQYAATVAYYYRFVAPQATRKEFITADDLQQACRLTGRNRFARPAQTLINAHTNGLLDKGSSRGEYTISTVGENLVAVTLPGNPPTPTLRVRAKAARKKRSPGARGGKQARGK